MEKITYNKLVRDRIPEIMTERGRAFEIQTLATDADFSAALLQKIGEEASEVQATTSRDELIKELADLAEVVKALCALKGIETVELEQVRVHRAHDRGSFSKRLLLVWGEKD